MKLLTLNTHSLIEPDYEAKREIFVNVHRKRTAGGVRPAGGEPDRRRSAAEKLSRRVLFLPWQHRAAESGQLCGSSGHWMLEERGVHYHWSWLPAKVGYDDIYDEGAAVFSRAPITAAENLLLSKSNDYSNWKTRRTLGICAGDVWYYAVHLGWWKDEEEPFADQWNAVAGGWRKRPGLSAGRLQQRSGCAGGGLRPCPPQRLAGHLSSGAGAGRGLPLCRPLMAGGMPRMRRQKAH